MATMVAWLFFFFFQAEDGIRDYKVTGVQTCALPICAPPSHHLVVVPFLVEGGAPLEQQRVDRPRRRRRGRGGRFAPRDGYVRRFHRRAQIGRASCRERV